MEINNIWWWTLIIANILFFFVYEFASMADGLKKELTKAVGLTGALISYILMLYFFGWKSLLFLIIIIPLTVSPFLIFILNRLEDYFFPERIRFRDKMRISRTEYRKIRDVGPKETSAMLNKFVNGIEGRSISSQKQSYKSQPIDPIEFPTLIQYDSQMIENKIQSLMKTQKMTRQQCLVNLEQDLRELKHR